MVEGGVVMVGVLGDGCGCGCRRRVNLSECVCGRCERLKQRVEEKGNDN